MNAVVEAVRQKYPGVYDDLTDDQLTLALGKKAGGAYDDIKEFSEDFKRVSPYKSDMADVGISGGEFENVQQVDLPPFGKPGTFTRGLSKALTGTVSGATSPGGVATGAALMVPGVGPALGVGLSAAALWQSAQKAQEAIETQNPEAAGEAAGMGALGAAGTFLGVRGISGPKIREGLPPRPQRPSPLPRATAEAAKEFKPSFTIGLPEEPAPSAPKATAEPKSLPAGEPTPTQPARAPATRTTIASRILQKAGLDPATADRFAGWVSGKTTAKSLEGFRDDVLAKFREAGLQFPGQISLYRTEPSYYEAMGFNPQEVAEHIRNAEIANRQAVSDVQAANARVLEQLESGKSAPAKPTAALTTRAPGTTTAMPAAGELTTEEAQNLFLDKATAEDNAAIEQTKPAPAAPEQAPETQAPMVESPVSRRESVITDALETLPFGETAVMHGTSDARSSGVMSALGYANVPIEKALKIVSGKLPWPTKEQFIKGIDDKYWYDAGDIVQSTWNKLRAIGVPKEKFRELMPQADDFNTAKDYFTAVNAVSLKYSKGGLGEVAALVKSGTIPKLVPKAEKQTQAPTAETPPALPEPSPVAPAEPTPAPAQAAAKVESEVKAVARTTPQPGTPEREAWQKERSDIIDKAQAAYEKAHNLREQRQKTSMGTKKYESLGRQIDKADDEYSKLKPASDKARKEWQHAGLEDVAQENLPITSDYAASELEARRLESQGKANEARKVRNDSWDTMKASIETELQKTGLSDTEAKDEALQIASMVSSYPLAESRRLAERFQNVAERVKSQRGLEDVRKEFDQIETPVTGTKRDQFRARIFDRDITTENAKKVLSEYKDWVKEKKKEVAAEEKKRSEKEAADIQAELLQAREWQAAGKLHWVAFQNRWVPVEGASVKLPGVENIQAFVRKVGDHWVVTEEQSGLALGQARLRADAIKTAAEKVKGADPALVENQIRKGIERLGPKPTLPPLETEPPAQGAGMPKGEIRSGPKPYDPSAGAMGIRPPLTPFMREDVIPAVQTVVAGITETLEGLRNLLSPVSAGPLAKLGAGIIREHAGRLAQKDVQMRAKFAAAHAAMSKMDKPSTLNWLDAVEGGARGTLTGPLRQFADEARAALDDRLRQVQALGTGKLQHFIQDYFPHLWKRPDNALNWLQRIFGKRPLRGPASFLKHRTIPTTREGVDAGLEPVSWNPMDILLAKLHEMDRYIMGQKIFQEFKDKSLAKFSRSDIPPQGYAKIDDRIGNVIQYRPTVTVSGAPGAPERILRGHWFVQEDAARVLNNFLSPGLERYAWYKALRWVGNNMNMATLGLSGYHGMFTMIDAGTSKLALGIEQATRGQPVAAATIPRGLVGTLAANQVEAFVKGSKVLQEYTKPSSVGGEYAKIVDGLIAAGGRVQMPEIYQNSTLRNFMNALRKGNYTGAVLRAPAAALHAFAYPLMNVVVPRLKLGVFFDMARMELDRLGPTATRDEVRAVLGKVWDSVDNRMGELVYDNLFWNKVLKDLSFLGIRSVGWNLGTLRELGGGVLDSATVIKRLSNGDPVLTRRMAYAIALPFTVGLMGAIYQYIRTGKGPQEAEDYFYPKTGNTLPEGQPERVNFPSYLKDVESVKRHPAQTVINKMHPMWGTIAEMLQNRDYYGTEIIHPGDPLVRKAADELKFIAKSFVPYGISGAEKRGKIEPGIQPKFESFFGIMPVPSELTRSPAENLAIKLMSGHKPQSARTKAEFERSQKERDAVQQIKMGKLTLDQAKKQGLVEPHRVKEVQERLRSGYLQYAMKHLSIDEAFQVLEKATPREASLVTTELRARIMRSTTIPSKEKQAYFKMLDRVSKRK